MRPRLLRISYKKLRLGPIPSQQHRYHRVLRHYEARSIDHRLNLPPPARLDDRRSRNRVPPAQERGRGRIARRATRAPQQGPP